MTERQRVGSVERGTGRPWETWLTFLDDLGAAELDHSAIAAAVLRELDGIVDSAAWWAQSVTVTYERHIGRRLPGQRADGTFQTSVSRSSGLPMTELMDRWAAFTTRDDEVRGLVVGEAKVGGTERRLTWRARAVDGTRVVVTSEPKKDGTASLVATQSSIREAEANDAARERWTRVLDRFLGQT